MGPKNHQVIVYHGSRVPFLHRFCESKIGTGVCNGFWPRSYGGFFFSNDIEAAGYFADFDAVHPDYAFLVRARLTFRNLYVAESGAPVGETIARVNETRIRAFLDETDAPEYDGILWPDTCDGDRHSDVYLTFDTEQITILGYGPVVLEPLCQFSNLALDARAAVPSA